MRKLYVFIFIAIFLIMSSCSANGYDVIYIHSDEFETLAEENFKYNMEKLLDNFKVLNIPNDEEFIEYFNKLSNEQKNNKNIFIVSEKFSNVDISDRIDKVIYINNKFNMDINNLLIDQKPVSYLLGIISGLVTRRNSIFILYSEDYVDHREIIDAFITGVREVNLRAYDSLSSLENVKCITLDNKEEIQEIINSESDIVFNLSKEDIIVDDKFLFDLNMDNISENLVSILYDYGSFINIIESGKIATYSIGIHDESIKFNLTNLPEEVVNIFNKYLNNIN